LVHYTTQLKALVVNGTSHLEDARVWHWKDIITQQHIYTWTTWCWMTSTKKTKAPSTQIGLGWKLAGLFF